MPVPRLPMLKWSLRLRWERDMVAAQIATERLILRPLSLRDCALIQAAARRREVADTMISIPHPFSAREAERYVRTRLGQMRRGRGVALCIWTRTERAFCGFVELRAIDHEHALAELCFWLAVDAWGVGYMSEAISAVLRLSFQDLGSTESMLTTWSGTRPPAECLPRASQRWQRLADDSRLCGWISYPLYPLLCRAFVA